MCWYSIWRLSQLSSDLLSQLICQKYGVLRNGLKTLLKFCPQVSSLVNSILGHEQFYFGENPSDGWIVSNKQTKKVWLKIAFLLITHIGMSLIRKRAQLAVLSGWEGWYTHSPANHSDTSQLSVSELMRVDSAFLRVCVTPPNYTAWAVARKVVASWLDVSQREHVVYDGLHPPRMVAVVWRGEVSGGCSLIQTELRRKSGGRTVFIQFRTSPGDFCREVARECHDLIKL